MKPKVLIVDDRPENLLALERLLAGVGANFVRAESGNQALAKTLENDFALALVDVQMPDMDGFETVELMRQQEKTRYLPVIFVSAIYNEEAHVIKGVETGAVDFIVKPIVPQILIGKVKIFLELYNQKKELEQLARDREKRELTFRHLAEGLIAGVNDQEIYNYIITTCIAIFHTEHALIGRVVENERVETCISFINGQISAPITYNLAGTPCENVVNKGVCLYPNGVQKKFPKDRNLSTMDIEGYVGVPLKDSHGRPLGILNAYSPSPLKLPDFATEVLEIIAGRAAAVIERQQMDEAKILLQERLQQAQKMEAIGTLAGGIAHDFNNILMPIMGFAEMSRESVNEGDPLRKNLDQVIDASYRAKELVQQILTFSRQSSQESRPFQIHLVVKEALKLLRATIPTTIKIREDFDRDCGMINADPTQIHQVVMNLCTNAYHAMRQEGGYLTVSLCKAEKLAIDMAQKLKLESGKYIKLQISDTGVGMDKATLDKIFEPYFTTKSQDEGTGLGLSVVHGIIESYKGGITVSSVPGKGTTFQVLFPWIPQKEHSVNQDSISTIPTGKEHVLLVDDEKPICRMMSIVLERLGYRVTSFNNPVDALEKFIERPNLFNLIITDMTMPEMTGIQFSRKILGIMPGMPIILCTGFSDVTDHKQAKSEGIYGYLMKPVSKRDMAIKIRELLDGPKQTNPKD